MKFPAPSIRCFLGLLAALSAPSVWSANHEVVVGGSGLVFTPSQLTINVGDTVTFRNGGGLHNVVSNAGNFRCATSCQGNGGNVSTAAWSAVVPFNAAGTFDIYCDAHGGPGFGMSGSITVVQGTPTPPPITAGYTGTWYDPARSGQGIFVEILPNNLLLAYWFAFGPDGQQAWFGGVGNITGNTAVVNPVRTQGGPRFPALDPATVTNPNWGTLTFTFSDCNNGRVDFNSVLGFGSGSMTLRRLTLPAGLTCPVATEAETEASPDAQE